MKIVYVLNIYLENVGWLVQNEYREFDDALEEASKFNDVELETLISKKIVDDNPQYSLKV